MLLLIIFSSFFVLLLPGAASPPPPAPSSSRDSSSPALLPSFFTPSSPLLSPSFTVILLGRRERKEGGTKSGLGVPQRGREIPGLRGEKFSCRNSSQHGRRCLLLNPLSFAVPTQQPVPRAGGESPAGTPPKPAQKAARLPRHPPEGVRGAFGGEIARPNSGVWQRSTAAEREERQRPGPRERSRAARPGRLLAPHPTPSAAPGAQGGSSSSSPWSRGHPTCRGGGVHTPRCGGGFSSSVCVRVSLGPGLAEATEVPGSPSAPAPAGAPAPLRCAPRGSPGPGRLRRAEHRAAGRALSPPAPAPGPAGERPGPAPRRPQLGRQLPAGGSEGRVTPPAPFIFDLKGNKRCRRLQRLFPMPHLDGDRAAHRDAATSWTNQKVVKHHLLEDRLRHRQATWVPDLPLGPDAGATGCSLRAALQKSSRFWSRGCVNTWTKRPDRRTGAGPYTESSAKTQ